MTNNNNNNNKGEKVWIWFKFMAVMKLFKILYGSINLTLNNVSKNLLWII